MPRKKTQQEILNDFRTVHGLERYDYSLVEYKNNYTKVEIICPIHGSFWQKPYNHLMGKGCVYCADKKSSKTNSLEVCGPDHLLDEWHYLLNGSKRPSDFTRRSNKKVWWLCPEGHSYKVPIKSRSKGHGCTYCSNLKVDESNCAAITHDWLLEKYHPTKNKLTLYDVTYGSKEIFWWICEHGHEWDSPVKNMAIKSSNCPICSRKRIVAGYNSLEDTHSYLLDEWDFDHNDIAPSETSQGSGTNVHWICNKGHRWTATPNNRIKLESECPYCNNQKSHKEYNLVTEYPEVLDILHHTKNKNFYPEKMLPRSDRKAWFLCSCGHEYKAAIKHITRGQRCPRCRSSKNEKIIVSFLSENNFTFETQYRIEECKHVRPLPFDFAVWLDKLYLIEYHGIQHYEEIPYFCTRGRTFKSRQKHDDIKRQFCIANNIPLLEIPYWDQHRIEELILEFFRI